MKKLPILTLLAAVLCWGMAPAAHAQLKIGTVNLGKIFDSYWKRNQADTQLKDRRTEFEKQQKELFDGQKANENVKLPIAPMTRPSRPRRSATSARRTSSQAARDQEMKPDPAVQPYRSDALGEQTCRMRDAILREILEVVDTSPKPAATPSCWTAPRARSSTRPLSPTPTARTT